MSIEFLDPTHESEAAPFAPAPRLDSLRGATVGVVSNGKQGTHAFFDALERTLVEDHRVAEVVRLRKANYSAPAEARIMDQAPRWDALVAGIGD